MKNTIAPAPAVSFTETTIKSFDAKMVKLGFIYEGTFDDCVWIYRKTEYQFLTIQVGFGGVLFVKIYNTDYDYDNKVACKSIDLSKVNTPVKLFNLIKKSV
jgi:hypothetical protein